MLDACLALRRKSLNTQLVFAPLNVSSSPPFSSIDECAEVGTIQGRINGVQPLQALRSIDARALQHNLTRKYFGAVGRGTAAEHEESGC